MNGAIQPQPSGRSTLTLWGLLEAVGVLCCLATVTGFLGRLGCLFELTSHFPLNLAALLGALAIVWLVKRRWWMAALCGVGAAVNAILVLSVLTPERGPASPSGPRLRLAAINVHTSNTRSDLVLEFLRGADADVILLMEVNQQWMDALTPLRASHPHHIVEPRDDNFGIALFSRLPLTNGQVIELGAAELPSISATVMVDGQNVLLVGTHPLPPVTSQHARLRNDQLREIAAYVRGHEAPVIVLGDLNATPWSPYFGDLLRDSGLRNTSQGRGLFGTWPAWLPVGRIPLDHCLVSPAIGVRSKALGPRIGGDHLPVIVDLQLNEISRNDSGR